MKRHLTVTAICLAACALLAGCAGSPDDFGAAKEKLESAKENVPEEKKEDESKTSKKKNKNKKKHEMKTLEEDKPADPETLYEPVFSEILEIIDYGYNIDREYTYATGGVTERINYPGDSDPLDAIGYVISDFSGDGEPELLIGSEESYGGEKPSSYIYGIYALKDGKPVTVVGGSARSSYQYMGDGRFFYCGSGGAAITLIGENHLIADGTEVEWDDFYFTDEDESGQIGIYYNNSGLFEIAGSKKLAMSDDEFADLMREYEGRCEPIDWTPIRKCAARGGSGSAGKDAGGSSEEDEVQPYAGVLYWYKALQDSGKSAEEMEKYTSMTELIQHGWPFAATNDEVGYVYKDLTGDGFDELIITYYGDPVDIYSNEGDAIHAYSVPYRAVAELFPDGTIMEGLTLGSKGWRQTWYRYDEATCKYEPVSEELHPEMSSVILTNIKPLSDIKVPDWYSLND